MGEIRSAREIAEEKLGKLGEATEAERLQWKYVPEGEKLASDYLKENADLTAGLNKYDEKARQYVAQGISAVLVRNIGLPNTEITLKTNQKALDGIRLVKKDQAGLDNIFNQISNIFKHYAGQGQQQRRQVYDSLKAEFEMQVRQALQQQLGPLDKMPIDVEKQPQFQAEWRRRQAQLDSQYLTLLDELKQALLSLA